LTPCEATDRISLKCYSYSSDQEIPYFCKTWTFITSCPDRLWGPHSLLSNGYRRLFPWE